MSDEISDLQETLAKWFENTTSSEFGDLGSLFLSNNAEQEIPQPGAMVNPRQLSLSVTPSVPQMAPSNTTPTLFQSNSSTIPALCQIPEGRNSIETANQHQNTALNFGSVQNTVPAISEPRPGPLPESCNINTAHYVQQAPSNSSPSGASRCFPQAGNNYIIEDSRNGTQHKIDQSTPRMLPERAYVGRNMIRSQRGFQTATPRSIQQPANIYQANSNLNQSWPAPKVNSYIAGQDHQINRPLPPHNQHQIQNSNRIPTQHQHPHQQQFLVPLQQQPQQQQQQQNQIRAYHHNELRIRAQQQQLYNRLQQPHGRAPSQNCSRHPSFNVVNQPTQHTQGDVQVSQQAMLQAQIMQQGHGNNLVQIQQPQQPVYLLNPQQQNNINPQVYSEQHVQHVQQIPNVHQNQNIKSALNNRIPQTAQLQRQVSRSFVRPPTANTPQVHHPISQNSSTMFPNDPSSRRVAHKQPFVAEQNQPSNGNFRHHVGKSEFPGYQRHQMRKPGVSIAEAPAPPGIFTGDPARLNAYLFELETLAQDIPYMGDLPQHEAEKLLEELKIPFKFNPVDKHPFQRQEYNNTLPIEVSPLQAGQIQSLEHTNTSSTFASREFSNGRIQNSSGLSSAFGNSLTNSPNYDFLPSMPPLTKPELEMMLNCPDFGEALDSCEANHQEFSTLLLPDEDLSTQMHGFESNGHNSERRDIPGSVLGCLLEDLFEDDKKRRNA